MAMIDREEAIRLVASYPGPVDKSVVRRILTQMPEAESTQECLVAMDFTGEDAERIVERIAKEPLQILPKEPRWIPCDGCERRCERWGNSKTSQD